MAMLKQTGRVVLSIRCARIIPGLRLLLACIVVFVVSAPSASPRSVAASNNVFSEADVGDAVSFHPYLTTDTGSSSYQSFVYGANLWRYNPETLQPEPDA